MAGWRSGSVTVNFEPLPTPSLCGDDLAVVLFDDAVRDRQAQAGALPSAAAREEWLEQVLHHFVGHAAAVVLDDDLGVAAARLRRQP